MTRRNCPGQLALFEDGWCQRTTAGRHSWRHTSEGGFDPRRYKVERIKPAQARAFILAHHYLSSYPSVKLPYGLIEGNRLAGVATLGTPTNAKVITNPLPSLDLRTGADLSRLVLLDEVLANAESRFIRLLLRDAFNEGVRGVVAFADGVPRPDAGMPGHVGIIYQASNADYCGRATAGPLTVLPNGTVLTRRTLQKVRAGERGAGGVVRRLVAAGADAPDNPQGDAPWLRRSLRKVRAVNLPHPGVHRFVIRPGTSRQQRMVPLGEGFEPRPYPKRPDPAPTYRTVAA
ncbi:hypothetical protein [Micromonospora craterilacus]|uniref:Mom family adenine methylcarbamoylation protein n=1 Tax=Micromonospora craterilacus TaxID=1655439 RepID=UPI0018F49766|nr:hypothetical protein [Micromonospora craterilacus]